MQEKINKRLAGLAILLVLAIGIVWWAGRRDVSYHPDKNLFRDFEMELVDKVVLRSPKDTITLKYSGSEWKVNEEYPADRTRVTVLFATLQKAEPWRPVSSSLKDSIADAMDSQGIRVSMYVENEIVQELIVSGNVARTETYFKKVSSDDSYVMNIPGYRTYVGGIFELDESGWRNRQVFGLRWENFKKLETRFRNPSGNFSVVMENGRGSIAGIAQADTSKLSQYMDYLNLLTVDEFLTRSAMLDSLGKTSPVAEFSIEDLASRTYTLALYPPEKGNHVYALLNATQWAVIQEDRIFPILRPKEFFVMR